MEKLQTEAPQEDGASIEMPTVAETVHAQPETQVSQVKVHELNPRQTRLLGALSNGGLQVAFTKTRHGQDRTGERLPAAHPGTIQHSLNH